MALNAQTAGNTQPSNPAKNRRRPMDRHQKPIHNSKHVCLSSQDEKKKTSIHTGITPTEKNTSTVPTHIIVVGPDDSKTMMAIGRIGADMRSAKDGIVLQRPSSHQRDESKGSSAGRQQSRSARSPQDGKKAVQQREPDRHHHQTFRGNHNTHTGTDWAP